MVGITKVLGNNHLATHVDSPLASIFVKLANVSQPDCVLFVYISQFVSE